MKQEELKQLKKCLKIEYICTIMAGISCFMTAIASIVEFLNSKDYENITRAGYAIFSVVILGIFSWIMMDVKKKGSPFVDSVVIKLTAIAIIVMFAAVVPELVTETFKFVENVSQDKSSEMLFEISFGSKTVFIMWLGIIIGVLSAIFKYGVKLQEDNDSIA